MIDDISCIGIILKLIYSLIMNISGELSAVSSLRVNGTSFQTAGMILRLRHCVAHHVWYQEIFRVLSMASRPGQFPSELGVRHSMHTLARMRGRDPAIIRGGSQPG